MSTAIATLDAVSKELAALQRALAQGLVDGAETVEQLGLLQGRLDEVRRQVDAATKELEKVAGVIDKRRILALQHDIVAQQDCALDAISTQLARVGQISRGIHDEVDLQVSLLTDLERGVETGNQRVGALAQNATQVVDSSGTCKFWVAIALLTIILVLLLAVG